MTMELLCRKIMLTNMALLIYTSYQKDLVNKNDEFSSLYFKYHHD